LNVHVVNDVRQAEVYTAALLVLEHSCFEVENAIVKLKKCK